MTGEDRVSFLQRQSTQDIRLVSTQRAVQSVLTSATGRILDLLTILPVQGEVPALAMLTLAGRQAQTFKFLRDRIFFMDRVEIQDLSSQYCQVVLSGPESTHTLAHMNLPSMPDAHSWSVEPFAGQTITVIRQPDLFAENYRLIAPQGLAQNLFQALQQAGAKSCDETTLEVIRIEAGAPGAAGELNEKFTPLEVNLASLIASNKGCYTGQEVIARQMNYDKVTRYLVGLRLDESVPTGSAVSVEERAAGEVTSAVISPSLGPIALAVIRRPYNEPGTRVIVETEEKPVAATVTLLPFSHS